MDRLEDSVHTAARVGMMEEVLERMGQTWGEARRNAMEMTKESRAAARRAIVDFYGYQLAAVTRDFTVAELTEVLRIMLFTETQKHEIRANKAVAKALALAKTVDAGSTWGPVYSVGSVLEALKLLRRAINDCAPYGQAKEFWTAHKQILNDIQKATELAKDGGFTDPDLKAYLEEYKNGN
jgi:hypothetical protein